MPGWGGTLVGVTAFDASGRPVPVPLPRRGGPSSGWAVVRLLVGLAVMIWLVVVFQGGLGGVLVDRLLTGSTAGVCGPGGVVVFEVAGRVLRVVAAGCSAGDPVVVRFLPNLPQLAAVSPAGGGVVGMLAVTVVVVVCGWLLWGWRPRLAGLVADPRWVSNGYVVTVRGQRGVTWWPTVHAGARLDSSGADVAAVQLAARLGVPPRTLRCVQWQGQVPDDWEVVGLDPQSGSVRRGGLPRRVLWGVGGVIAAVMLVLGVAWGVGPVSTLVGLGKVDAVVDGHVVARNCSGRGASGTETVEFQVGGVTYRSVGFESCKVDPGLVPVGYWTADPTINTANITYPLARESAGRVAMMPLIWAGFVVWAAVVWLPVKVGRWWRWRTGRPVPGFIRAAATSAAG